MQRKPYISPAVVSVASSALMAENHLTPVSGVMDAKPDARRFEDCGTDLWDEAPQPDALSTTW